MRKPYRPLTTDSQKGLLGHAICSLGSAVIVSPRRGGTVSLGNHIDRRTPCRGNNINLPRSPTYCYLSPPSDLKEVELELHQIEERRGGASFDYAQYIKTRGKVSVERIEEERIPIGVVEEKEVEGVDERVPIGAEEMHEESEINDPDPGESERRESEEEESEDDDDDERRDAPDEEEKEVNEVVLEKGDSDTNQDTDSDAEEEVIEEDSDAGSVELDCKPEAALLDNEGY